MNLKKSCPCLDFDNAQYRERKSVVEKQYPQFSSVIPTYSSHGSTQNEVGMSWDKVIGEEVKSADDKDLGKVESIAADYVEVKEGTVNKKHYYIPKSFVEEFDGKKSSCVINKR